MSDAERISHTPAPWTIEEYGDDNGPSLVIHKDSETRICFMATPGSKGDPAKIEANSHLISAAPDMLAALKECVKELAAWNSYETCLVAAYTAIARAEGRDG